ncbi:hypothetical protein [Pelagibacterium mangrovi]|uniref:hypothetical protein n=1 Tax=Pelagibacterium mangrovi TaxID=3119828 RepID=UPI002FCB575C
MTDEGEGLGDILKRRMGELGEEAAPEPIRLTSTRHDLDDMIVALAAHWGSDPDAVLNDFHSNTPLSNLLRKILGVDEKADGLTIHDYYAIESLRERGLTLERAFDQAADEAGKAGRRNGKAVTSEGVSKSYKRGQREILKRYKARIKTLTDLFTTPVPHLEKRYKKRDK